MLIIIDKLGKLSQFHWHRPLKLWNGMRNVNLEVARGGNESMARALRIEYPDAVYHVMARGYQGQATSAQIAETGMKAQMDEQTKCETT